MANKRSKSRVSKRGLDSESRELRSLVGIFNSRGIDIRQEKLVRGSSYRAKSGSCRFEGRDLIFLDRRLSPVQQAAVLTDYLVESEFSLSSDEISLLEPSTRALIEARG